MLKQISFLIILLMQVGFTQSSLLTLMGDDVSETQQLADTYTSRVGADGGSVINPASLLNAFTTIIDNSISDSILVWVEADLGLKISGDSVLTIYDLKGYDLNQDDLDSCAGYRANTINSTYPSLGFITADSDTKHDVYHFTQPVESPTRLSVFIVLKKITDPSAADVLSGLWRVTSNTANSTHWNYSDNNIYDDFGTDSRKTVGNPTPDLTDWHIYEVRSTGGEFTAWLDGTQLYTTATNTVGIDADCRLGRSLGEFYFYGNIAAFILTITHDHTVVRNYLSIKYGITLP